MKAKAVGAFSAQWSNESNLWMFPPMHKEMQNRITQRLQMEQNAQVQLVVPLWETESMVKLLQMLVGAPVVIPVADWVFKLPQAYVSNQDARSLAKKVQWSTLVPTSWMIVMNLSSTACLRGVYLKRLQRTLGEYTNKTEMETTAAGILVQSGLTLFSGAEEKDLYWCGLLVLAEILVLQMRW
jgi:hypothetical protein